jgi:hypothetical protein
MNRTSMKGTSMKTARTLALCAVASTIIAASFGFAVQPAGAVQSSGAVQLLRTEPGDTTTSLPEDNRLLGNSIQRPNMGMKPLSPTDPGGWLQVSLFFLICGGIILIAVAVWSSSRKKRIRREEAGLDPVSLARATGKGVRAPSPLDRPGAANPETPATEEPVSEAAVSENAVSENASEDS